MANCCYYDVRVFGFKNEEDKTAFLRVFDNNYHNPNFSNVTEVYATKTNCLDNRQPYMALYDAYIEEHEDGVVQITGDCKWSVATSMLGNCPSYYWDCHRDGAKHPYTCLEELSKKYGVIIEVFSEEGGMGFKEHYVVKEGKVVYESCVDWESYYAEDSWEKFVEETADGVEEDAPVTKEEYERQVAEGEESISVGGFEDSEDWVFSAIEKAVEDAKNALSA